MRALVALDWRVATLVSLREVSSSNSERCSSGPIAGGFVAAALLNAGLSMHRMKAFGKAWGDWGLSRRQRIRRFCLESVRLQAIERQTLNTSIGSAAWAVTSLRCLEPEAPLYPCKRTAQQIQCLRYGSVLWSIHLSRVNPGSG